MRSFGDDRFILCAFFKMLVIFVESVVLLWNRISLMDIPYMLVLDKIDNNIDINIFFIDYFVCYKLMQRYVI